MAAAGETLEDLGAGPAPVAPYRRMLVVTNPFATAVSDHVKDLVVHALGGRYGVETVDTEGRGHATELCRQAGQDGYDVVVVLGGDGTVNEAANGLAGSLTPLTCLPGGATNVYCRMLGIPTDAVEATRHLLRMADAWRPVRVDLGRVNDRHFLFASGLGLDASVVERVDLHPRLKARLGEWYFAWAAISTFSRRYLVDPPRLAVDVHGESVSGVTAVVQNGAPYSYFGSRPIDIAAGAELGDGSLAGIVLRRASPIDMPTILWRAFSRRAQIVGHRHVHGFGGVERLCVRSLDGRPLPLQVDGDHIGEVLEAEYRVAPRALTVVA